MNVEKDAQSEIQKGSLIERDGKKYWVTSVQARLSRYKPGGDTVVKGYTLGLVSVDNPRAAIQHARTLEDLKEVLPDLYKSFSGEGAETALLALKRLFGFDVP